MIDYGASLPLLSAAHTVECHLIELNFSSGTSRYNTSAIDIEWDGYVWFAGMGAFSIEFAAQSLEMEAHGAKITLAALNPARLGQALTEKVRGRTGVIYHAILSPTTFDPIIVVREDAGVMSALEISSKGTGAMDDKSGGGVGA